MNRDMWRRFGSAAWEALAMLALVGGPFPLPIPPRPTSPAPASPAPADALSRSRWPQPAGRLTTKREEA